MDSGNKNNQLILADFFADWCGPCDHIKPILKDLENEFGEELKIVGIDIDKDSVAAAAFKVRTVPTLILFRNGESLWRHTGQISLNEIVEKINQFKES